MNAAIVGVAGFLGTALARRLVQSGWQVAGFDLTPPDPPCPGLAFQPLDVLAGDLVFPAGTDVVFYLAQSPFYRQFPQRADHLFGVNMYGAVRAACAACRAGARLVCYTSSGNVYVPSLEPLSETHPVRRDDPYALSKLAAEEALALFAPQLSVVVLRLFGLFGPGQRQMLPARLADRIRAGQEILLEPAPGETNATEGLVVSFTYVEDAARCMDELAQLALRGKPLPTVLNLAGPEPISLRRFGTELGKVLGTAPRFARASTVRLGNLIADVRLLHALCDACWVPFSEAVARTYGPAAFP